MGFLLGVDCDAVKCPQLRNYKNCRCSEEAGTIWLD